MAGVNSKTYETQDENFEIFSLLWLDAEVNRSSENIQAQQKLRLIINHLKTFDDEQQCYKYISSLSAQDRVVLIVSGRYGQRLVPKIHQLRQLASVYVYCMNKQVNEQWARSCSKVKNVIVRLDELIDVIRLDQQNLAIIEDPLSLNVFNKDETNPDLSTTGLNGQFVHSLLLIDVLIRIKPNENDKSQLIKHCKKFYANNANESNLIEEFGKAYSSSQAIWWYTREAFLYRMLNKALRMQNIDALFLFRFVIADMYQQLREHQCRTSVRVFRGQIISSDELNTLQRSIGGFISINSFFSTSTDPRSALRFIKKTTLLDGFHRILFSIDADPNIGTTKPFANIQDLSFYRNEDEVLFMIGCVFHLIEIDHDHERNIWIIRMNLCEEDGNDLKELFQHMKNSYGRGDKEANLRSLGDVLRKMGKYEMAEKVYRQALDGLSLDKDSERTALYQSLGTIAKDKNDYEASLTWFNKALEIKLRVDPSDYTNICSLYNWIGTIYRKKGDHKVALDYYNQSMRLLGMSPDKNQLLIAHLYNNIANVYDAETKYAQALKFFEKSLAIRQTSLPAEHPSIAMLYNNIGCVHRHLDHYDLAKENHQKALQIRLKTLPSQHPDIAMSYRNLAIVYEMEGQWKRAYEYYGKAAAIYRQSFESQHSDVIQIEKSLQHISSKLNIP